MRAARPQLPIDRRLHAAGLTLLLVGVAFAAGGLQGRAAWPASAPQAVSVLAWTLGLHGVLLVIARLVRCGAASSAGDYARALGLLLFSAATLWAYVTPNRVGPIDALWYGNMMTDFLAQARAGAFPVLTGTTAYAFNGAVHPFRSAPWHFVLADAIDIATGHSLAPLAVQHLTALASFSGAVLVLFAGLARARPRAKGAACLFALVYGTSPSFTASFFLHDMYMTLMAAPLMVAVLLCLQRAVDEESGVAYGWLGAGCAALWYCHPPMALLTGLVVAFCLGCHAAISGIRARTVASAGLALAVFAALALPYFTSMAEVMAPGSDPVPDAVMPALGLALLACFAGGLLRSGSPRWLAPLAVALLCFASFKPSLIPFAACFAVLAVAAAIMGSRYTRLGTRAAASALFFVLGLVAAVAAVALFARVSLPGNATTAGYVAQSGANGRHFFQPIARAIMDQPGYMSWFLLGGTVACMGVASSAFARYGAAAALVLVCALGLMGKLSLFLWLNCPPEFIGVFQVAYDLRLLPVLAPVVVAASFFWWADLRSDCPRWARALLAVIVVLVPWTAYQHVRVVADAAAFRHDAADTARHMRTENTVLERYSWDLLLMPRFFSNGVMDPSLETRFWSPGRAGHALITPDSIERSLEKPGQPPVKLAATPIPTGPTWLRLAPRIELDPGQHVLVRFDFLGRAFPGWLIVQGQAIYREYILPYSGQVYAFGSAPGCSHTLSLWNSGSTHESLELFMIRGDTRALTQPEADAFCLAYITPYDPLRAPIELLSLTPVHLRVTAPSDGYLETFRSHIPGYKVSVDGRTVQVHRSDNGLVSVWLNKGEHDVRVRFAGTPALHTAVRWAIVGWSIALLALVIEIALACAVSVRRV